jgi:sulfatase maturation enzyme AslB (radical SAM superfamily)
MNSLPNFETICSKAFTDINIDLDNRSVKYCCKSRRIPFPEIFSAEFFDNNSQILDTRKDLLSGIKNKRCVACWNDNDRGKGSYRDLQNSWRDQFSTPDEIFLDNRFVRYVEIKLDKTCDMSCLYCSPVDSSRIFLEENPTGKYIDLSTENDIVSVIYWLSKIIESVKINKRLIDICFMGGEPTLSKKFPRFVNELNAAIPEGYKDFIRFSIITNCNSPDAVLKKTLMLLDSTKCKWNVGISNESMGEVAELTRYGLNWETFEKNFQKYLTHPNILTINLCVTVNLLSFNSLYEYIEWVFDTQNHLKSKVEISMTGNFAVWPGPLDISNLDVEKRKYCDELERLCKEKFKSIHRDRALKFVENMRKRIGSSYKSDHDIEVVKFLGEKVLQKKDVSIIKIYKNFSQHLK